MIEKLKRPFHPYWLIFVAILFLFIYPINVFSFIGIFIVAAFNYGRMEKLELKKKMIKYVWIGFGIFWIVFLIIVICLYFFVPRSLHKQVISVMAEITCYLNIGIGLFLAQKQLSDYTEWKLKNEFKKEEIEL